MSVPRLRADNGEHADLDARAVACFDRALTDVGIVEPARSTLHDYFAWATTRMAAHPDTPDTVPDGEVLPHSDGRWTEESQRLIRTEFGTVPNSVRGLDRIGDGSKLGPAPR